jgi:hypothetical protein
MRMAMIVAFVLVAGPASADCPGSMLWECGSDAAVFSSLPGATSAFGAPQAWAVGEPCTEGCYDVVHGGLEAVGSGNPFSPGCATGAWMNDDYWIEGPPGGAVSFEAVLFADVTITGSFGSTGGIFAGPASDDFYVTTSGAKTLVLGLSRAVGEVFPLVARLETFGGGTAEGTGHAVGTLRFRGLPAGYSVVSCQGYALPTPARPATWGGVKALYRD